MRGPAAFCRGPIGVSALFQWKPPAYNAAGGNSTGVHLPDEGITGNDHFMFQDLNNDVIADHIENWIQQNVQ